MASEYDSLLEEPPKQSEYDALLAPEPPKREGGVLSGIVAGVGRALNPINLVKGALDIGHESDISNIVRYGKTLGEIVTGKSPDEAIGANIPELQQQREAAFGQQGTREQAAYWTGAGLQLGLVAAPFLHGRLKAAAPEVAHETPLAEVAGIERPSPTEPVTPETPIAATEPVATEPIVQPVQEAVTPPTAQPQLPLVEPEPIVQTEATGAGEAPKVVNPEEGIWYHAGTGETPKSNAPIYLTRDKAYAEDVAKHNPAGGGIVRAFQVKGSVRKLAAGEPDEFVWNSPYSSTFRERLANEGHVGISDPLDSPNAQLAITDPSALTEVKPSPVSEAPVSTTATPLTQTERSISGNKTPVAQTSIVGKEGQIAVRGTPTQLATSGGDLDTMSKNIDQRISDMDSMIEQRGNGDWDAGIKRLSEDEHAEFSRLQSQSHAVDVAKDIQKVGSLTDEQVVDTLETQSSKTQSPQSTHYVDALAGEASKRGLWNLYADRHPQSAEVIKEMSQKPAPVSLPTEQPKILDKQEPVAQTTEVGTGGAKTRLDLILDGVDKHGEVTLTLDKKLSREKIQQVEDAATARGMTAAYDGQNFLIRKNPEAPSVSVEGQAPTASVKPEISATSQEIPESVTPETPAEPQKPIVTETVPPEGEATGIAARYREDELGPDSVVPGVGKTPNQAREYGIDYIKKGGDPYAAVRRAEAGNTSWRDVGVARAEFDRLGNEKRAAESVLEANPNDPLAQLAFDNADLAQRKWSKDAQPILTAGGDALRAATRSYARDITTMSDITDIINDHYKGGVDLVPQKRAELQKALRAIKKGDLRATETRAAVTDAAVKKAGGKVLPFEDLKANLQGRMEELLKNCAV